MNYLQNPLYAGLICSAVLFVLYSTYVRIDMYNHPDEYQTPDAQHRLIVSALAGVIVGGFMYLSQNGTEKSCKPNDSNLLSVFDAKSNTASTHNN